MTEHSKLTHYAIAKNYVESKGFWFVDFGCWAHSNEDDCSLIHLASTLGKNDVLIQVMGCGGANTSKQIQVTDSQMIEPILDALCFLIA